MGFLTFLAGLNAVNAVILWAQQGPDAVVQPYLVGGITGELSIATYLWISILATFVFLGMTLSSIIGSMSDARILEKAVEKVESLKNDQKTLKNIKARLMIIDASLSDIRRGFLEGFNQQAEDVKKIRREILNRFEKKLADFRQENMKQLEKTVERIRRANRKNQTSLTKQLKELASVKLKLEKLEKEIAQPKPKLTSQSEVKKIRGIGTRLANELRGIGITNVGELLLTDPETIAEKTNVSKRIIEKMQGRAQLLMVPGITEKDIILLEELGITTKKELANQDPIELGRKMNGILGAHIEKGKISETEKPTIEEISSWIRFARS